MSGGATRGLRYMPWAGGEFRWRLGLRPLDLDDWIQIGDDYAEQMATKSRARAEHPETVFVALPEARDACAEVLDLLVDLLTHRWPDDFQRVDGRVQRGVPGSRVVNRRTGDHIALDGSMHPLDAAGRLVQEDLIVMVPDGEHLSSRLVFGAGSVCLPNRWDLRAKLGRTMADVHAPVSRLNDELGDTIDRFFDRLEPDRSYWRLGWGVIDSPDLFQPLDSSRTDRASATPAGDDLHVRVERETLRRLPRTGAVLFTIRTYITSAASLVSSFPDDAARLREAIAAMPDDVRSYKQIDVFAPAIAELFSGLFAGRD